ncbi:MAG TPA: 1,4-alpha-glucan branching protein domain-containing protein [Actinomycetes bacterium]
MTRRPVGTLCVVLHTHLPWVAHHGTWPVGEEWLHQAWSSSYLPLVEVLHRLAEDGMRDVLTLGLTPVLAAQLDDPYCLREHHSWLGRWRLRAEELAGRREPHLRELASYEFRAAERALTAFAGRWAHGGSAALRPLVDAGVVEHLGGPATHPIQPLLPEPVARFALRTGLDDAALRLGHRPRGIWAPECAYRPGLEELYAEQGVTHFLVDQPLLEAAGVGTGSPWRLGTGDVTVVGRDLALTDRIWSSRSGYPAGSAYRDFHTFDHDSGFRPAQVTGPAVAPRDKLPYDPDAALAHTRKDAHDFVDAVHRRLRAVADAQGGRPGLAVVAYDTELFGHWWHEGPAFLEQVLRLLPQAGVRLATLGQAVADLPAGTARLGTGSWGAGKDLRIWAGEQVHDLARAGEAVTSRLQRVAARVGAPGTPRRTALDQLGREALLALSSDWAFMVSRDSAAGYARERALLHARRFHELADLLDRGEPSVGAVAARQRETDGPFAHLDGRLAAPGRAGSARRA